MPLLDIAARLDAQGRTWQTLGETPVIVQIRISGDDRYPWVSIVFFGVKLFIEFLDRCTDSNFALSRRVLNELAEKYWAAAEAVYVPRRVYDSLCRSRIDLTPLPPAVNRVAIPLS